MRSPTSANKAAAANTNKKSLYVDKSAQKYDESFGSTSLMSQGSGSSVGSQGLDP